ncbi:hypothetical protein FB45DRAFT_907349 [Roridomyces roridus]|uniref:Uncharacterized protein n=1 Tax=Roridomyces roridus TaxID=1738132 RepID=A0AAD7FQ98_9AGAR|nr:hypothetical protein FB45DRAFT_907349 [Roridomyces roridus]
MSRWTCFSLIGAHAIILPLVNILALILAAGAIGAVANREQRARNAPRPVFGVRGSLSTVKAFFSSHARSPRKLRGFSRESRITSYSSRA